MNFINEYRIVPRLILIFSIVLCYEIAEWFMALEAPNNAQAGFTGGFGLSLVGIVKYYLENGVRE